MPTSTPEDPNIAAPSDYTNPWLILDFSQYISDPLWFYHKSSTGLVFILYSFIFFAMGPHN